jgi:hypothetical protein
MGTMVGLMIGYALGTRAGEKGYDEFRDAWKTITTSDEVRALVAGGVSIAGHLLHKGSVMLAERLQGSGNGVGLRRVA